MLDSVSIRNFRGLDHVVIPKASRVNLLVGDNGSGKTSVLEAMFLTLSSQTESALRIRTTRGFEGAFSGTPEAIERALWKDIFRDGKMSQGIEISLEGKGILKRSLFISKSDQSESFLAFDGESVSENVNFTWRNFLGESVTVTPKASTEGLKLPVAFHEKNISFYFAANTNHSSVETAQRYSDISQENRVDEFFNLFKKEYKWIEDISIELSGSVPSLYIKTAKQNHRVPLPSVSGGINRIMSILLAIYGNPNSIILVDEIENGQHYSHHDGIWRLIFDFVELSDSQIFVTSHSKECIDALFRVAKGNKLEGLSLHQMERRGGVINLSTFNGNDAALAVKYGEEIR